MNTTFISKGVWPELTKAAKASRQRCDVAVAYFGRGASRLLPLPEGSRLVVDASERSVGSGQTCPADLIKLVNQGVAVYSVPNLHAKVFVMGRTAYIGSANVSGRSATQLVEAVVRTTELDTVRRAREFVRELCLHELTPTVLRRLAKLYRSPIIPGDRKGKKRQVMTSKRPSLPRVCLAQLELSPWSDRDQALHDAGEAVAKQRQKHPRAFELESFRWSGRCPFQEGDLVIQITEDGNRSPVVTPPANVRYIRSQRYRDGLVSFVYLERPTGRRTRLKALALKLGCAQKQLHHDGLVRQLSFAQSLLKALAGS